MTVYKRYQDLSGMRFGRWTVLEKGTHTSGSNTYWLCQCDCGNKKEIQRATLIYGTSKQCGECCRKPKYLGIIYRHFFKLLQSRAKKYNFDFSVTPEYLGQLLEQQNHKCALTGLKLDFHSGRKGYTGTASLDRIDSSRGYVFGSVQWVHRTINFMKGSLPQEEFIVLCHLVSVNQTKNISDVIPHLPAWMPTWNTQGKKKCRNEMRVFKDGNAWCFVLPNFENLQVSPAFFPEDEMHLDEIHEQLQNNKGKDV
jgi:hypothetical protein